ncbi:MAG TPA: serpin family protein [Thermomicrobiales bacterium]|nr:serpin family protein [Thermomicrobiales bacterium]
MSFPLNRLNLSRRHLVQTGGATLVASQMPFWSVATHAQSGATADLVAGNTDFALDLYAELRQATDGNLLVSPYSVSLALAMVYLGAAGDTASQMADTLGFELDPDELASAFGELSADLEERGTAEEDEDEGVAARGLTIANSLWGEETFPFSDTYMEDLDESFGAELNLVDFAEAPDEARDEINDWVAENTNERIEDIVPEGAITADTRLVLANAIWFAGAWRSTFEPDNTEDGDFTLLDGSTVEAPFMRQTEGYLYAEGDGFQVIELPYEGSGFAFTILLPDDGEFEAFEESLDREALDEIMGDLEETQVRLRMPRFTFDYDANLADTLQALGMTDAFDGNEADFSGMVEDDAPSPLVIGGVLHKAFIDLNEHGTEAAAATVVIMEATSAQEDEPIELAIDRPFVFAIRDTESGSLLFVGRVLDPSS